MNKPQLKSIYYYISSRCNLKCRHCWINPLQSSSSSLNHEDDLSLKQISDTIDQSKELGLKLVKLTGGEPFLRSDILKVIELIDSKQMTLHIETNGTLIDQEVIDLLKKVQKNNTGFFISISLDGSKEAHDDLRGVNGAYERTLKVIGELLNNGIKPQLIMSLYKKNSDDLKEVIKYAESSKAHSLKLNFINPVLRGEMLKNSGEILDVEEILDIHHKVCVRNVYNTSLNIFSNVPPVFSPLSQIKNMGRCGLHSIMGLLSNGDVSLCGVGQHKKSLIVGNVKHQSVETLWNESGLFENLREQIPKDLKGICSRCVLKSFCLGCCRASSGIDEKNLTSSFYICEESYRKGLFPEKWLIK